MTNKLKLLYILLSGFIIFFILLFISQIGVSIIFGPLFLFIILISFIYYKEKIWYKLLLFISYPIGLLLIVVIMQNYWVYDLKMKEGINQFVNEQIYLKSEPKNRVTDFSRYKNFTFDNDDRWNNLKLIKKTIKLYNIHFGGALKDKYLFCADSNIGKIFFRIGAYKEDTTIFYHIHDTTINQCTY